VDITIHLHWKSLASAGLAVLVFALSFIGVPRILAWALVVLALLLLVFAVFVWLQERKSKSQPHVTAKPTAEEEEKTSGVRLRKPRGISEADHIARLPAAQRHSSELAKAAASTPSPARVALAKAAAGDDPRRNAADALIRRGETLRNEVVQLRKPIDRHTARYQPNVVLSHHVAQSSLRYVFGGPTDTTNTWLADVSRFVAEHAPARSVELYPKRVDSLDVEKAAIEQTLAVLREVADGVLESLPREPTPEELQAAVILTAKHDQAVLSAYRDILRSGRALLEAFRATQESGLRATPEMRSRAEDWFKRCGDWASGNLSPEQRVRTGFDGAPRDSTTDAAYFGLILRYVNALEAAGQELGL
jgi:hypothetical protein